MLLKSIKLNSKPGKIYFLGDAHLNHNRPWIVEARGFSKLEDHDKYIIDHLMTLNPNDTLVNLGDFALMSSVEFVKSILHGIKARHYYACNGNHESFVSKIYREELLKQYPTIPDNTVVYPLETQTGNRLTFLGESSTFRIEDKYVYCRHMAPLIWDHMKYDNNFSLVAHSHSNLKSANPDSPEPKQLDIGVDNAMSYNNSPFFEWHDILKIMQSKKVKIYDHHGSTH